MNIPRKDAHKYRLALRTLDNRWSGRGGRFNGRLGFALATGLRWVCLDGGGRRRGRRCRGIGSLAARHPDSAGGGLAALGTGEGCQLSRSPPLESTG